MPDMLLTLFVTVALWQGWRLTRGRPRAWLGFYGATGLAFWTKGPAGLLPLLLLVVWALLEDRRHRLASLRVPRGLALLAALVAPWPLIGLLGQPSGLQAAVVNDQMAWYLRRAGSGSALVTPLQNAFGILFPWELLTPLIVVQAVRALRGRGGGVAAGHASPPASVCAGLRHRGARGRRRLPCRHPPSDVRGVRPAGGARAAAGRRERRGHRVGRRRPAAELLPAPAGARGPHARGVVARVRRARGRGRRRRAGGAERRQPCGRHRAMARDPRRAQRRRAGT